MKLIYRNSGCVVVHIYYLFKVIPSPTLLTCSQERKMLPGWHQGGQLYKLWIQESEKYLLDYEAKQRESLIYY